MEKSTPHCKLTVVKTLLDAGKFQVTRTARNGASALGFDYSGMLAVVAALQPSDFYKSMTTHADHTVWQRRVSHGHPVRRRVPEADSGG